MSETDKNQEIKVFGTPKEAIELMANAIGHYINNRLGPIVGFSDLLKRMTAIQNNPKALTYIKLLEEAGWQLSHEAELFERLDPNHIIMIPGTNIIDLEKSVKPSNPQEFKTR